jgi:hypothetical protein
LGRQQPAPLEGIEKAGDGTKADRRHAQLGHEHIERNFTMANIKKLDTQKFKITVSNGYRPDS